MLLHRGPAHFLVSSLVCLQASSRLEARVVMAVQVVATTLPHQVLEVEAMAAVALVVVVVVDSLVATEVVVALVVEEAASLHLEVVVAAAFHLCLLLVAVVVVVVVLLVLLLAEVVAVDLPLHPFQHLALHPLVIPLIPSFSL